MNQKKFSCTDCGVYHCYRKNGQYPSGCLTTGIEPNKLEAANKLYRNDPLVSKLSRAAAEMEGEYYCQLTRVEEVIMFAKKIGAKKIGIATCVGLINEAKLFAKMLTVKGLTSEGVLCKVGAVDKTEVGVAEAYKIQQGGHESMCNPVLQAEILNQAHTDLNVIVGLCVGHDSIFIKYSEAPVTTLITKDRVLGHNPIGALHTCHTYYQKLLQEDATEK